MLCEVCEKHDLIEVTENYLYLECGLPNIHLEGITLRKCPECGNIMPLIPGISKLHLAIAGNLIKKPGRLTPSEIIFLRKHLGWSGVDFARNMHSTSSQVSKWESGKVMMSTQAELLLREMVARGKKIDDYHSYEVAKQKQVSAPPYLFQLVNQEWKSAA
jgi:putative zinc finger/helix-turn-helix YgiT family protein